MNGSSKPRNFYRELPDGERQQEVLTESSGSSVSEQSRIWRVASLGALEYSARWYRVGVTPWLIFINQGVFCSMEGRYPLPVLGNGFQRENDYSKGGSYYGYVQEKS
jgi:hypothetical protein